MDSFAENFGSGEIVNHATGGIRPVPKKGDFERSMGIASEESKQNVSDGLTRMVFDGTLKKELEEAEKDDPDLAVCS